MLLSQDKRTKILEAAEARFLYYGVAKTSMRDIANDLGISVSNLYLYFENRRELVLAIAENCRQSQAVVFSTILSDSTLSAAEKLKTILLQKFELIERFRNDYPQGKELIAYLAQEFPERVPTWQDRLYETVQTILEEGTQQGCFHIADVPHATQMLRIATTQFFQPAHIVFPVPPKADELLALIEWFISRYPATREGQAPYA